MHNPAQDDATFDQRRLLRLATRHWVILTLAVLIGIGAAIANQVVNGVEFTARAVVIAGQPLTFAGVTGSSSASTAGSQNRAVDLQLKLLQSDRVESAAEAKLPEDRLPYTVNFQSGTDSDALTIVATSKSASLARTVANGYGTEYLAALAEDNAKLIDATEKQIQASLTPINTSLAALSKQLTDASEEDLPNVRTVVAPQQDALYDQRGALIRQLDQVALAKAVAPGQAQVVRTATIDKRSLVTRVTPFALGGLLGLLLGVALVSLLEARRGGIKDRADVHSTGLATRSMQFLDLRVPRRADRHRAPTHAEVVGLRRLGATLWPSGPPAGQHETTLLATVDDDPALCGAVGIRLGEQLVALNRKVLVVDITPDGSALAPYLPQGHTLGLADVLRGDCDFVDAVVVGEQTDGLATLGAGAGLSAADLTGSMFEELLTEVGGPIEHVLVVGPGLLAAEESIVVAPKVTSTLIVLRSDGTRRRQLQRLVEQVTGPAPAASTLSRPDLVVVSPGRSRGRGASAASDASATPSAQAAARRGTRAASSARTGAEADLADAHRG